MFSFLGKIEIMNIKEIINKLTELSVEYRVGSKSFEDDQNFKDTEAYCRGKANGLQVAINYLKKLNDNSEP
jgi:hypothetical protein